MVAITAAAAAAQASATALHEFSKGLPAGSDLGGIAAGPDGNLWFTDGGSTKAIGRITPAGKITMFRVLGTHTWVPERHHAGTRRQPVVRRDRNAEQRHWPRHARGKITEFVIGPAYGQCAGRHPTRPWRARCGSSTPGRRQAIGRVTTDGTITEFGNDQWPEREESAQRSDRRPGRESVVHRPGRPEGDRSRQARRDDH